MGTVLDCFCDKDNAKKEFHLTPPLNSNIISNEESNSTDSNEFQIHNEDEYFTKEQLLYYQQILKQEPKPTFERVVGKFQKGETLGKGSFGKVSIIRNISTGQSYAVKEFNFKEIHKRRRIEFADIEKEILQEIENLTHLNHKHVIKYHGTSKKEFKTYIILEYCDDGSLTDLLDSYEKISTNLVRKYTFQILKGLEYLHIHNIMHLDIKSDNILINGAGDIKLADFGLAKVLSSVSDIKISGLIGTRRFMAPEVINDQTISRFSDIWSLGCTVFHMAEGKKPWSNYHEDENIIKAIRNEQEFPDIPEHFNEELKDFLKKCLQYNPKKRANVYELRRHKFLSRLTELDGGFDVCLNEGSQKGKDKDMQKDNYGNIEIQDDNDNKKITDNNKNKNQTNKRRRPKTNEIKKNFTVITEITNDMSTQNGHEIRESKTKVWLDGVKQRLSQQQKIKEQGKGNSSKEENEDQEMSGEEEDNDSENKEGEEGECKGERKGEDKEEEKTESKKEEDKKNNENKKFNNFFGKEEDNSNKVSHQNKTESNQNKTESNQNKIESNQNKTESNQNKINNVNQNNNGIEIKEYSSESIEENDEGNKDNEDKEENKQESNKNESHSLFDNDENNSEKYEIENQQNKKEGRLTINNDNKEDDTSSKEEFQIINDSEEDDSHNKEEFDIIDLQEDKNDTHNKEEFIVDNQSEDNKDDNKSNDNSNNEKENNDNNDETESKDNIYNNNEKEKEDNNEETESKDNDDNNNNQDNVDNNNEKENIDNDDETESKESKNNNNNEKEDNEEKKENNDNNDETEKEENNDEKADKDHDNNNNDQDNVDNNNEKEKIDNNNETEKEDNADKIDNNYNDNNDGGNEKENDDAIIPNNQNDQTDKLKEIN